MDSRWRIGIDTGGTFTDFVFFHRGKIHVHKLPSTPADPAQAILRGLSDYQQGDSPSLFIVHGTTVATNALLERRGGRIALITTKGFEDILFIARQTRRHLYSLKGETRTPLLPRSLCFGLEERIGTGGKVLKEVSDSKIEGLIRVLKRHRVEAVAVCLIHSYANPSHEEHLFRALERAGLRSCISCRLLPEHREYERTAVTAVNAYLMPVVSRYLESLEQSLGRASLWIMQSNEGYISPHTAKTQPIRTALSGPAGGVVAAFHLAKSAGYPNLITFDMGGTSTDVSLIPGHIRRSQENQIGEFPIRLPMIDIHTVGAGGGSIAYVDKGGALRVGPQSAGAHPGPACYGEGEHATVTDANLVLGRLFPELFLGGKMKLFPERSQTAVGRIAGKIGKSIPETAAGILAIANANMEKAIRVISIERGIDPRRFVLCSFGGAGGMHAAEMASHLGITTILIPKNAGVLSALGLLLADSIKDYSQSLLRLARNTGPMELEKIFKTLAERGFSDMQAEGFDRKSIRVHNELDLRYWGQSYEITLPYRSAGRLLADFHKAHKALYAYQQQDQPVEIVNLRVKVVGKSRSIKLPYQAEMGKDFSAALIGRQSMICDLRSIQAPIVDRALLTAGNELRGPALVADRDSTTLLPPGFGLKVDGYLNLIINRNKAR
jgi:N-methylhydantoinase A/oxoprolinase/acetone carboxylase beta subunit